MCQVHGQSTRINIVRATVSISCSAPPTSSGGPRSPHGPVQHIDSWFRCLRTCMIDVMAGVGLQSMSAPAALHHTLAELLRLQQAVVLWARA